MTSTMLANATIESGMTPQLSDAVLGGIIGGAIAGLVLFLTITIAAVYCIQRRKRLKLESPEDSVDPFTYVRQVNHIRDGSWTIPPGSTILFESPTLPVNHSFKANHLNRINSTGDRFTKPEIDLSQPEVIAGSSTEAEVVVEKRTQARNCVGAEREPGSTTSETGFRIGLEPDLVTETGFGDDVEPESGTGLRDELDVESSVDETGLRDRRSVKSLNVSLSEDYCNRVIDEAFLAIDNFAYSDNQSADMEWV